MKFYIKEAREQAGFSQKELAEKIGVAPNTFHGYESGKHDPKSDQLIKIATACNVSVDFLLGVSFDKKEKNKPAESELDELDKELLRLAAQLTPEQKRRQVETLRDIVGKKDN